VRWANLPLGLAVALLGLVLASDMTDALNHLLSGVIIAAVSFHRGEVRHPYAGGWRALSGPWRKAAS
jgi:hypothetical protein